MLNDNIKILERYKPKICAEDSYFHKQPKQTLSEKGLKCISFFDK